MSEKEEKKSGDDLQSKPDAALVKAVADGNLSLEQRIMKVMDDVVSTKIKALEAKLDVKIDDILKAKEVEMEHALRRGFGLENDPVIHQSDLVAALRKAALDQGAVEKRAPESKEKAGPEGSQPEDPFDAAVKAKFSGGSSK